MSSNASFEDPPPRCTYRMETGQDLIDIKQCRPQLLPDDVWCLEASWEVANKQGGIYTVIRSKARVSVREMGERYILLGPLMASHAHEVEPFQPSPCSPLARSLGVCREKGWQVMAGRWLVEGNPTVVLFDIGSAASNMDAWKHDLYEKTHIGIPHLDIECNDLVILGFMIAQFIADFQWQTTRYLPCSPEDSCCRPPAPQPLVVAHFHEWMSGIALILLRLWKVEVATVFTTHATLLGRHLCAGALDFYKDLENINVDEEAGKRKIYHRYCIERATAHLAHVFTTVSDITAEEASHLIKRRPDFITPNGLSVKRTLHEFQNLHQIHKEKIMKFIHGHFHGHINFDLDKTLLFFTAGRYEFGNKGGDVFIESLARLNHYLQACGSEVTVIAFIIFPAKNSSFNMESLKGHAIAKSLQETVHEIKAKLGRKLYETCSRGEVPSGDMGFSKNDQVKLKRVILAAQRSNWPPITTHNVCEEEKDPVLLALKRCNLLNNPDDRVKVVFHPDFLNSDNPLLGLSYEEFVRGCHLGVFPSYYEPWGYTPAECTVMGVPSVTSNLSGFGCFIEEHIVDPSSYGIYVVDRKFQAVEETVRSLAQNMFDFSQLSRRQRIIMRNRTERLSDLLDWKRLGVYYTQARAQALARTFPGLVPDYERVPAYKYPRPESSFGTVSRRTTSVQEEGDEID
eukprot:GFUD01017807.1.p1 GENE.GFUD01017807.1~~GFUD01017807.1.p1  ORF type:complete len:684 (-),score=164.27 GFUD01017807.1:91-2142(-)